MCDFVCVCGFVGVKNSISIFVDYKGKRVNKSGAKSLENVLLVYSRGKIGSDPDMKRILRCVVLF